MRDNMCVRVSLRECWVKAGDLTVSCAREGWTTDPTLRAIVIESISVDENIRNRGHFARFLDWLCRDARYDLVIVEGVQNVLLREYLSRRGMPHDRLTKDFYFARTVEAEVALTGRPQRIKYPGKE